MDEDEVSAAHAEPVVRGKCRPVISPVRVELEHGGELDGARLHYKDLRGSLLRVNGLYNDVSP